MANFNLRVNNRAVSVDVDPATPLLYVLADELALNGPKFGCGLGQCGACTVIVKGQAILCRCFAHQRMIAAVKRYANGGPA